MSRGATLIYVVQTWTYSQIISDLKIISNIEGTLAPFISVLIYVYWNNVTLLTVSKSNKELRNPSQSNHY